MRFRQIADYWIRGKEALRCLWGFDPKLYTVSVLREKGEESTGCPDSSSYSPFSAGDVLLLGSFGCCSANFPADIYFFLLFLCRHKHNPLYSSFLLQAVNGPRYCLKVCLLERKTDIWHPSLPPVCTPYKELPALFQLQCNTWMMRLFCKHTGNSLLLF